ncbi:MAG TPA: hypothetical protein VLF19_03305 [Methylomirabilota bacterium]|nr:hypothetical protein [Methylomirabilota bacterium]
MKKTVAMLMLATPLTFALPSPAAAGASEDAALALGAFAVFNQLVRGETVLHGLFGPPRPVVVQQPPVVYAPPAPPPVVYAPAPVVVYAPRPPVVYAPPPAVIVRPGGYWAYRGVHRVWVAHPAKHRHWKHR